MEQPAVLQWFKNQIDMFAPAAQRAEREQCYATLRTLTVEPSLLLYDNIELFVLAQIVAAHQLARAPSSGTRAPRGSAHETWYAKERQRITRLLAQIADSPVVSTFQSRITYYDAADVTCEHGHNQKTCEALYALRLTLHLLEQHPGARWVRKHVERLRQREPHLPALPALCMPVLPAETSLSLGMPEAGDAVETAPAPDELTAYLLGTIVVRLRHTGLTLGQSCALVDQILACCLNRPDPAGTRPAMLAEQWRRLNQQNTSA